MGNLLLVLIIGGFTGWLAGQIIFKGRKAPRLIGYPLMAWHRLVMARRTKGGVLLAMSPALLPFAFWGAWYFPNPASRSYQTGPEFEMGVGAFFGVIIGLGFLAVFFYFLSKAEPPPQKPTLQPTRVSARPAEADELKDKGLIDEG